MVKQFTSNSSNREEILKSFEESKIHVLTSMKCLDEGVDVPRSELAIFCASTGIDHNLSKGVEGYCVYIRIKSTQLYMI